MVEFRNRLIQLREENNITRLELAKKIGLHKSSITRYENDNIKPTLDVLIRISNEFDVSLDWLAGYETEEERKYKPVIKECIKNGISPDKIFQFIHLISEES